jgi:hypothetical protein
VTDVKLLTNTVLMTRSPCIVDLGIMPEDAGLILSAAARWESKTGEFGYWSSIRHSYVAGDLTIREPRSWVKEEGK